MLVRSRNPAKKQKRSNVGNGANDLLQQFQVLHEQVVSLGRKELSQMRLGRKRLDVASCSCLTLHFGTAGERR